MSISLLLSHWRTDPEIAQNIDASRNIPFQPARFAPFPVSIHPALVKALQRQGITTLYIHQSAAWEHTLNRDNIVVVTGTASGKTLCYNLPVLDHLLRDPQARALYLFPTKALAQDQFDGLRELVSNLETPASNFQPLVSVYDGDTPSGARPGIRAASRLILSNPDMLHTGILPHHTAWAEFFSHLQFVVIDEMHIYRGVFGSHMANVLRRLKRIAHFYGSFPQFILTSATIANPRELAGRLIEEPISLVDDDGAARGSRTFLIYNPPIINKDLGLRKSALQESVRLAGDLLAYNVQTIIFARSRRSVEIILTYLRQVLPANGESIRGYRSGYLPRQRREIERGLRQGEVRAVVATNALELGIDIGQMGASLLVGYPGTIAAVWQQAGRAGRGDAPSLAVLIATADPLDQFLASHSEYFFEQPVEQALVNPDNLLILLGHLNCAAFELPFQAGDSFGKVEPARVQEFLEFLKEQGVLHQSGIKYFWMADQYPAQSVSLRSASADTVLLQVQPNEVVAPTVIGKVDYASALWMVHPQAIYLHEGQAFSVESLDLDQKVAHLLPVETDYYTEPRAESIVQLQERLDESEAPGGAKAYGEISVTTQVIGFRKVKWYTHEQLGLGEVTLPPTELQTTGYWLSLSELTVSKLQEMGLWTNAANDYGPDWPAQRDRARLRDGYRCQVCGAPEQGRAHDVHHKAPLRTFASSQVANQLGNLITLCPTCHRRAETVVRVRSGLAGLSFVLGHLAPFYLMCDTRDLGVHSDPQSPLADGSPAVVLYDQVPAGIGFSQRLFELHDELMLRAFELVSSCECVDGCPSCVGPGGENGQGGRRETLAILQSLTYARSF